MAGATRVVSLLPSATEIVSELGLFDLLVGRSEECDWPPTAAELPVVSASRVDTAELSGREVDDAVRAAVANGRSLYALDEDLLRKLQPDLRRWPSTHGRSTTSRHRSAPSPTRWATSSAESRAHA
jgi:iron complex transport system substrate-binding protein